MKVSTLNWIALTNTPYGPTLVVTSRLLDTVESKETLIQHIEKYGKRLRHRNVPDKIAGVDTMVIPAIETKRLKMPEIHLYVNGTCLFADIEPIK